MRSMSRKWLGLVWPRPNGMADRSRSAVFVSRRRLMCAYDSVMERERHAQYSNDVREPEVRQKTARFFGCYAVESGGSNWGLFTVLVAAVASPAAPGLTPASGE